MFIIVFNVAIFCNTYKFIGLLPRKELKMKKEVMNKEVKNKPVNEVKNVKDDKKKILTCRMCRIKYLKMVAVLEDCHFFCTY